MRIIRDLCGPLKRRETRGPRVGDDVVDGEPDLFRRVAVADGDGVVVQGVEVDGDAEGRADLVLAAVASSDGARDVPLDVVALLEVAVESFGDGEELGRLLDEGEDGDFYGGDGGVELEDVALLAVHLVLFVGLGSKRVLPLSPSDSGVLSDHIAVKKKTFIVRDLEER